MNNSISFIVLSYNYPTYIIVVEVNKMARKGRDFELAYKQLYTLSDKYVVTSPKYMLDYVTGEKREVDVLIEYIDRFGNNRKISVECRDRKGTQDVTWIEQLITKREDLRIDQTIAITTSKLSAAAILKAKKYGIIVEQAELFRSDIIERLSEQFFFDLYFFKFELLKFDIAFESKGIVSYKDYYQSLNVFERMDLIQEIQKNLYPAIEPRSLLEKTGFNSDAFFSSEDNRIEVESSILCSNIDSLHPVFKDAKLFNFFVRITPFKVTLPLQNSISVFDAEDHSNKKYRATFTNGDDFVDVGYIEGDLITNYNVRSRKFSRIAGLNTHINTVFPDEIYIGDIFSADYFAEYHIGEFDMSQLLK